MDKCPNCNSENIYQDGNLMVCPECGNEWVPGATSEKNIVSEPDNKIRDANGNVLSDGDTVTIIKDLKIKGAAATIKSGTKVKGIRLHDAGDGHDISCKIDGIGSINLKSEFVRKV